MYNVVRGDTFALIARKKYGTEQYTHDIIQANPGASEPLQPGTVLIIPERNAPTATLGTAVNPDEVAVLIEGKRFRFWTEIKIARAIDTIDTLELSAPFEPNLPGFKETFSPFSFKSVVVTVGGEPLFKGTLVTVSPSLGENKTIQIGAYSMPGVLNDCTAPSSAFPLEFNNLNIKAITEALIKPFGLVSVFEEAPVDLFRRVALKPERKVLNFLTELAKQKNLVISSTSQGELLFQKAKETGTPVANLRQGESPLISIAPAFKPQEYYSHITGISPTTVGQSGGAYTVKNSKLEGVLRPLTFQAQDAANGTIKKAVDSKIGRMFGNMVSYTVQLSTWRDSQGALWQPNTIINLQADSAMIYSPYNFLIRSVNFNRDGEKRTATLNLIFPSAFAGKIPEAFPWD